eukprot:2407128-Alexandrium_andersonii.AAC.1
MHSPGPFRRDRAFISAMPSDARSRRLPQRRAVLDKGWRHEGEGLLPTMMRPRQTGKGCVVFSA